jgi:hypothetical protein
MDEKLENTYLEACINHGEGIELGDSKKANKAAKIIFKVVTHLKNQNNLKALFNYLDHENDSVRGWSASYLLDIDQDERAINTLKNLTGKPRSSVSFSAEITLKEWGKGRLRMYFLD